MHNLTRLSLLFLVFCLNASRTLGVSKFFTSEEEETSILKIPYYAVAKHIQQCAALCDCEADTNQCIRPDNTTTQSEDVVGIVPWMSFSRVRWLCAKRLHCAHRRHLTNIWSTSRRPITYRAQRTRKISGVQMKQKPSAASRTAKYGRPTTKIRRLSRASSPRPTKRLWKPKIKIIRSNSLPSRTPSTRRSTRRHFIRSRRWASKEPTQQVSTPHWTPKPKHPPSQADGDMRAIPAE